MRTIIITIIAGIFLSTTALAETAGDKSASSTLLALKKLWHFSIVKHFPTREPGITGYVVKEPGGKYHLLFTMGTYVFSGNLIDADGSSATRAFAETELPKPDYAAAGQKLARDSHLLTEGRKGAPEVFVFADPNCIFCHKFWDMTRAWVHDGKIRLHWVMVGFLKPTSPGRAAAIMAAKNGVGALSKDEVAFDTAKEEGAIKPLKPIPPDLQQELDRHGKMMADLGFGGTPSLVFRDSHGKWQGIVGLPHGDTLPRALGFKP